MKKPTKKKQVCSSAGRRLKATHTSNSGRTLSRCGNAINQRTGKLKKGFRYTSSGNIVKAKKK